MLFFIINEYDEICLAQTFVRRAYDSQKKYSQNNR